MTESYIFEIPIDSPEWKQKLLPLKGATKLYEKWEMFGQELATMGKEDNSFLRCFMVLKTNDHEDRVYCAKSSDGQRWFVYLIGGSLTESSNVRAKPCCEGSPIFISSDEAADNFYFTTKGLFVEMVADFFKSKSGRLSGRRFRFCPNEPSIRSDGSKCKSGDDSDPTQTLMTGFASEGLLYLIGKNGDMWMTTKPGFDKKTDEPIPMVKKATSQFFVDRSGPEPSQNMMSIVGIVTALLFVLVLIIGLAKCGKTSSKKSKSKGKSKKGINKGSSGGRSQISMGQSEAEGKSKVYGQPKVRGKFKVDGMPKAGGTSKAGSMSSTNSKTGVGSSIFNANSRGSHSTIVGLSGITIGTSSTNMSSTGGKSYTSVISLNAPKDGKK